MIHRLRTRQGSAARPRRVRPVRLASVKNNKNISLRSAVSNKPVKVQASKSISKMVSVETGAIRRVRNEPKQIAVRPSRERPKPPSVQSKLIVAKQSLQQPIKKIPAVSNKRHILGRREPKLAERKKKIENRYSQFSSKITKLKGIGRGRVLIMVACGPSIKEVQLDLLTRHPQIDFMVINKAWGYDKSICPEGHGNIWPPKFWVFCDHSQYTRNKGAWESYKGTIINSAAIRSRKQNQIIIRHRGGKGFSRDILKGYHIGRSTTYANMQVAFYMNYDKIYIFGLDMCQVGDDLHSYGKNPDVSDNNRMSRFQAEAEHYSFAATKLNADERSKFTICSSYNPYPFADQFGRMDHKEAPKMILKSLEDQK